MTTVMGLDIGGANTKTVVFEADCGRISRTAIRSFYYPIWKKNAATLPHLLETTMAPHEKPAMVVVTLTAELSDVYAIKAEGVQHLLGSVMTVFPDTPIRVLDYNGHLITVSEALRDPISVAGANWPATGWLVGQKMATAVTVDTGSTSTSIIPIYKGGTAARGRTDLEKLQMGELVYTGTLRTTIPAITSRILVGGVSTRVAAEWFAQSGDVHRVLGHISDSDYTVDTPDGRPASRESALARLARVVCADTTMLSEQTILQMAFDIYEKQLSQIQEGIEQVVSYLGHLADPPLSTRTIPIVVTGLGRRCLGAIAAKRTGAERIVLMDDLYDDQVAHCSPAYGVALMALSQF